MATTMTMITIATAAGMTTATGPTAGTRMDMATATAITATPMAAATSGA